ncbi:sensor histidine kinase [Nocardia takedensis]|uniref:sensor histidine kinase n=1 Tax=Nocardia takedensis TaxID=259390 RepID=UPI003F768266
MYGSKFISSLQTTLTKWRWRGPVGVRTRLLAIVLIPSITLLGIGVGASIYLVNDGRKATDWAELASATTQPAKDMIEAFQAERTASILHLAGDATATANLAPTRKNSDTALVGVRAQGDAAAALRPDLANAIDGYQQLYDQMPPLRAGIDARAIPATQVFTIYSTVIDTIVGASLLAAEVAPDSGTAVDLYKALNTLRISESVARASTIGATALLTGQISGDQFVEFARNVGDGRGEIAHVSTVLTGPRVAQYKAILDSDAYRRIVAMEDAFLRRGVVESEESSSDASSSSASRATTGANRRTQSPTETLPMTAAEWQAAGTEVQTAMVQLWLDLCRDTQADAKADGEQTASNSAWGGAAIGGITVLAFLAALFLANRLIGRMRKLRAQTLELADQRLPETIRKLGQGKELDQADLAPLDFGSDEIGQVADAFNRAHTAAVNAAVAESKTREGVNAVFLNIAHRSQVMVHRQLALLDRAEREEENPGKLDTLFQLDHLATRARRNAENLIILGGEKPGRRWRNPVPLMDVVRSAVAESLDYTRIQTGKLPELRITGSAVADLIHLLAELTDNATAFSPPESRVELSGNVVGKGVAIQISDQGLGMSHEELIERNAILADPPDFSVAALSSDARLGLFVVGKLAQRHGISVRLSESDYGGVRAIVLVPTTLIADDGAQQQMDPIRESTDYAPRPAMAAAVTAAPPPPALEPPPAPLPHRTPLSSLAPPPAAAPPQAPPPPTQSYPPQQQSYAPQSYAPTPPPAPAAPAAPDKPALPRRRRTAPEAVEEHPTSTGMPRQRSADEARSLMSAIENGTRQGRLNRVESDYPTQQYDRQEGAGDDFQTS